MDVTSEDELPTLRTKRCLFYMYAVVCHSAGELTLDDAVAVIPKPQNLSLQPSTLNPQPSTLNPQPSTLNP